MKRIAKVKFFSFPQNFFSKNHRADASNFFADLPCYIAGTPKNQFTPSVWKLLNI